MKKNQLSKIIFRIFYPFAAILFLLIAYLSGIFESIENKMLDFRFRYVNRHEEANQEIIFIDIDEYSLSILSPYFGGWPWPRGSVFGEITDYIMEGEPAIVIFDILFTELSSKSLTQDISDEDSKIAEISLMYPNLSHASQFTLIEEQQDKIKLPEVSQYNFEINIDDRKSKIKFPPFNTYQLPFSLLNECSSQIHFVNHVEDNDGISRRCNILLQYDGKYYPSLSLRGLIAKLKPDKMVLDGYNLLLKRNGKLIKTIQLDESGRFQIDFYDTLERFSDNTISAGGLFQDVLKKRYGKTGIERPSSFFKDKVVIIGSSANGLKDIKVTPVGKNFAGPFIHISTISNVLNGQTITIVPLWINMLIALLLIVVVSISTLYVKNKYVKNGFGFFILGIYLLFCLIFFRYGGVVLNIVINSLSILIVYLGSLIFFSLSEESEKKRIQTAMGKYLAPSVMDEVLKNYSELVGEVGQKKDITVLFSDIRSFTTFSEKFSAETVVSVLNRYLEKMIDVIFEYKGTLDKIVGDEIMAFWGAPSSDEERDYHAVKTAMVMQERLEELNQQLVKEGYSELRNGVGINSGDMIVGNIGSAKRLDYTLIGDNVNLGARIEGLTKYYKVKILITESTYMRVKERFLCAFLDLVAVKGKSKGIKIYTPLAEIDRIDDPDLLNSLQDEAKKFETALSYYFEKQFERSKELFSEGTRQFRILHLLSGEFVERC